MQPQPSYLLPSSPPRRIRSAKGVTITLGKTGLPLCPMTFILPYIARRGAHPGPLFCFREGSFLTRERFVREVRRLLTAPTPYSGHSFRIGAATTARATNFGSLEELGLSTLYSNTLRVISYCFIPVSCGTLSTHLCSIYVPCIAWHTRMVFHLMAAGYLGMTRAVLYLSGVPF